MTRRSRLLNILDLYRVALQFTFDGDFFADEFLHFLGVRYLVHFVTYDKHGVLAAGNALLGAFRMFLLG